MRSVQGPDGSERPETWMARLEHPALPPRPPLWPTPPSSPSQTSPPSLSLQLNPFLEHRRVGVPPIIFDIRFKLDSILLGEREPDSDDEQGGGWPHFRPAGQNGAQPATYPGVTALSVTALADDMMTTFSWPVTAMAHHPALPVTVENVLDALYQNFQEFMTKEELDSLTEQRRQQVLRAYEDRARNLPDIDHTDGVRRVDFLGDRCIFRGLEPPPDGEGFTLFVGPPQ